MERGLASVLFAPTMHGSMHNSILVGNLRRLHALGCAVVEPRDAYGKHNLPDEATLVEACAAAHRTRRSRNPQRSG
jgi:phosphopantothenoylcysteine decarboxylase/phosphopantothenate--cysteine ligase